MKGLVFYLGAATLGAAGTLCLRRTNPYSRVGGEGYLRRDRRRSIGRMLFFAAGICLAMALIIQNVESSR